MRGISMGYEALLDDVRKDMIAIDERLEALEAIATAKKSHLQVVKEEERAAA